MVRENEMIRCNRQRAEKTEIVSVQRDQDDRGAENGGSPKQSGGKPKTARQVTL